MHNGDIGFLVPAADIVSLAETSVGQYPADRRSIVSLHFEPADQLNLIWEAEAIWRERRERERSTGQAIAHGTLRHESAPIDWIARQDFPLRRGRRSAG